MAGDRPDDDSEFLSRFRDEPEESGPVVRRVYPRLEGEAPEGAGGPVDEGEPSWRERRWVRWLVVALIWAVALMLVASVLLTAF